MTCLRLPLELFDSLRAPLVPVHAEADSRRERRQTPRGTKRASPKNKKPLTVMIELPQLFKCVIGGYEKDMIGRGIVAIRLL